MAQSQIRQPNQEDIIRALTAGQTSYDPTTVSRGVIAGDALAEKVSQRQQDQQEKLAALQEKIAAVKREREFQRKTSTSQPDLADVVNAYPKETANEILKSKLASQSDEAKLARAQLKGQQPDKIKQLFQVGDKTMGVTYGGDVKPIEAPGPLNPLPKTLPADEAKQLGDFDTLSNQIQMVRTAYKPEFTGPLQSRTGELSQVVDLPSVGLGASKDRSDFLSNVNSIRNQLIYLRSGKQINEKEYERLLSELPDEHKSDVDFNAKLNNFENVFNQIKANRRSALSTGFNLPGTNTTPAPAGNPGQKTGFKVIAVRPSPGSK